jgi:hypothetical protein
MSEHTPTPWNCASRYSSVVGVPIVSRTGQRIGNTAIPDMPPEWDELKRTAEANAAFIVKAVNSHDALMEALQKIANGEFDYLKDAMNAAGDALASSKERA